MKLYGFSAWMGGRARGPNGLSGLGLALALTLTLFAACQSPPSTGMVLPSHEPQGSLAADTTLIGAGPVTIYPADRARTLLFLASLPLLGSQIDTDLLAADGYAAWRQQAMQRTCDVKAVKIRFSTEAVAGQADIQSGMLFLPDLTPGQERPLTWIIHAKGTELRRDKVPSNNAGAETPIAAAYASLGYAVWMPDYAGMGDSPGVHPYCVPESLARSAVDGLAAARAYLALKSPASGAPSTPAHTPETGRLYVIGYSEGGLAAMATAKAFSESPPPGLRISAVYAMGAPLNLTTGAEDLVANDGFLGHPEYHVFLAMGWARAWPDSIRLDEILTDRILQKAVPLFDGSRDSGQLLDAIARILGKDKDRIRLSDIFCESYIARIRSDPSQASLFARESAARLDRWLPPGDFPLVMAASPADRVVAPSNSQSAHDWIKAADPDNPVELVRLCSPNHVAAGAEALLWAILRIDSQERDPALTIGPSPGAGKLAGGN